MVDFYLAVTPDPATYQIKVKGGLNQFFCFKIGDSGTPATRIKAYHSHNPVCELYGVTITKWAQPGQGKGAYELNINDAKIWGRVANWYGTGPDKVPDDLQGILHPGTVAQKCIFGPNYGRMPDAREWFVITSAAGQFVQETFSQAGGVVYDNMDAFINAVYKELNPEGL